MSRQLPAGWYVDPSDAHQYRWWAGDQWTTHVRDKTEVDIAAAEEAMRPLPDFDAVEPDATIRGDGRRHVPVLLAVAVLIGLVATAGIVAFRPDGPKGHELTGEIRVPTGDVAGWTRRAGRALGDGAPCGDANSPGIGAGTQVVITSARGDQLGQTELEEGTVDRSANSTTCVFAYSVDGLDNALVYVVKVGTGNAHRARYEAVENANWTLDLRLR